MTSSSLSGLKLGRIQHGSSLRDMVEEAVSAAIVTGEMQPGEVVSAPTLAAEFGVSVTPVREAMMNLEKKGFVTILRNKGFRVTEVSDDDLAKIVDVRRMLEVPSMARLATTYPGLVDQHERFRELAATTLQAATDGEFAEYVSIDLDFHVGLVDLLGNEKLTSLVSELRAQTRLIGLAHLTEGDALLGTTKEHDTLLDLLETGRSEEAAQLMHRHIGHVVGHWSGRPDAEPTAGAVPEGAS